MGISALRISAFTMVMIWSFSGIGQQTLLSGGSESEANGYVISHSIGEVFIATLGGDGMITQGQQQPEDDVVYVSELVYEMDALMYPNPFQDELNVRASDGFDRVQLFGVDGALVLEQTGNVGVMMQVIPGNLAKGMYTVVLLKEGRKIFVGRVIKA